MYACTLQSAVFHTHLALRLQVPELTMPTAKASWQVDTLPPVEAASPAPAKAGKAAAGKAAAAPAQATAAAVSPAASPAASGGLPPEVGHAGAVRLQPPSLFPVNSLRVQLDTIVVLSTKIHQYSDHCHSKKPSRACNT